MKTGAVTTYAEAMGAGNVIGTNVSVDAHWEPATPGAVSWDLMQYVCKQKVKK